ncbi:DUF6271 family protein, partial [Amycolatopsis kentuckyensis]|uniref:DUF6271 family protein n=1 Tax=Amycolatopsis kentuckyensis TaxID=218823 RepID=UPI00117862ED
PAYGEHAGIVAGRRRSRNIVVLHLGETEQRAFLRRVTEAAGAGEAALGLLLPRGISYGACTDRAFLIARALGCDSVHRRDSDSRYQLFHGGKVFPVHHELASIGRRAADVRGHVTSSSLAPEHGDKPVVLVGGSFVGDLSVDLGDLRSRDRTAYHEIVSLWAPEHWTDDRKAELVAESFTGAGTEPFTEDRSEAGFADPMRVDMCNVAFHGIQEQVPLPPATDTIGSDYFLFHLARNARLPGVVHNRHIVNFHTGERKTDAGFLAYQLRLTKFFLSMLYFHHIYARLAAAGAALLDHRHRVRPALVAGFARESTGLADDANVERLERIDKTYRGLGGRYAAFADFLAPRREELLSAARHDIGGFATLIDMWERLMTASAAQGLERA